MGIIMGYKTGPKMAIRKRIGWVTNIRTKEKRALWIKMTSKWTSIFFTVKGTDSIDETFGMADHCGKWRFFYNFLSKQISYSRLTNNHQEDYFERKFIINSFTYKKMVKLKKPKKSKYGVENFKFKKSRFFDVQIDRNYNHKNYLNKMIQELSAKEVINRL